MAYKKHRTFACRISVIRIQDRWPSEGIDICICRLAAREIGASYESFSLTLVDVGLEEGGLIGPIPIVALGAEVYVLVGIVPLPTVFPREFPVATISVFPLSEVP